MSLQAFVWAARLPIDACGATEYRVLVLLADHAHSDGRNAFRSTESIADELHTSKRTIQRAVKNLRIAALIAPGDQELVKHIRSDRRPVVYDLNLRYGRDYDTPEPLEQVELSTGSHGVTKLSRGDTGVHSGVTTGDAHRTVIEPLKETTKANHRADVTPPCTGRRDGQHIGLPSGYCYGCGHKMRVEVDS